jgi:hypothetical protein
MYATLDGQKLFDDEQLQIEIGSLERGSIERTMPGLDGVLTIDMGSRGRQIKLTGSLQAKSLTQLNARIDAISAYMDGQVHRLVTGQGEQFDNLRMDVFKVSKERSSGMGLCCDYEIVYRQLMA